MNSSCPPSRWASAGNAITLWVWHSEEGVCFFLMLGVRNPSLFSLISYWDAFFLNLFWAFTFFLSSSPLKWTLKQDTSYISICKKLNQSSWPLLVRLIYFFFLLLLFTVYLLPFNPPWFDEKEKKTKHIYGIIKMPPQIGLNPILAVPTGSSWLLTGDISVLRENDLS